MEQKLKECKIKNEELRKKVNKFMPMLNELSAMLYEERINGDIDMIKTSYCEIYFKF